MSTSGRRSSLLNIDNWLDKCPNDEPDSMIYDPDNADAVAEQIPPELRSMYQATVDICSKIGMPTNMVEERFRDILECRCSFYSTIEKDMYDEYEKFCKYYQDLLDQITKINNDLHLPAYVQDDSTVTLLQKCKRLKTKFTELNELKQKRLNKLQQLRERQIKYCSVLGIEAPQLKTKTDIPSDEELNKLSCAVVELEKEEKRRIEKYHLTKDMIAKCMEQVEYTTPTESEERILSAGLNLSEDHLRELSNLHSKLENLNAKNEAEFKRLNDRLVSLFDRLDVGQDERVAFFEAHHTCKPSIMAEMKEEIEHYEEIKRQNIGKFIEKIKQELAIEYEHCCVLQSQQDEFFALSNASGECNEELLELCERELERIKAYYQDNKEILDRFQKWRMMWNEWIELELKANDPNRFKNRGGQLLLDEKKQKYLKKALPEIEAELTKLSEAYSARNQNSKFQVFGDDLNEFIRGCRDELTNVQKQEREERRAKTTNDSRRPLQAQVVMKRTPSKRAAGAGITPTPSKLHCQRSILGTPANRSNQLTMSSSVQKSSQKSLFPPKVGARARQQPLTNEKSSIPVINNGHVNQRDKMINSNGSDFSALSLSEQEFEDIIVTCPASAKRPR